MFAARGRRSGIRKTSVAAGADVMRLMATEKIVGLAIFNGSYDVRHSPRQPLEGNQPMPEIYNIVWRSIAAYGNRSKLSMVVNTDLFPLIRSCLMLERTQPIVNNTPEDECGRYASHRVPQRL